jgi:hypothetical protein
MDPFQGLVVSGAFGLLAWFVTAAAVGTALRWLDVRSRRRPATPPQGSAAKIREAA